MTSYNVVATKYCRRVKMRHAEVQEAASSCGKITFTVSPCLFLSEVKRVKSDRQRTTIGFVTSVAAMLVTPARHVLFFCCYIADSASWPTLHAVAITSCGGAVLRRAASYRHRRVRSRELARHARWCMLCSADRQVSPRTVERVSKCLPWNVQ
jgi:hypothetical protein